MAKTGKRYTEEQIIGILKKLVAEQALDNQLLKEALGKD